MEKEMYFVPSSDELEVKTEGVVCQSGGAGGGGEQGGGDPI